MKSLYKSSKGLRWNPDADAVNAPEGSLLRADNLVPDPDAQLALRPGSEIVYSGVQDRVHSLYSCYLNHKLYRFVGADNRLYRNGVDFGDDFGGFGDIAMGDDAYQAFFAREKTKKKFDGENFYNWSIPAPEFPPSLVAVTALTAEVASFASGESPAFVINEGTSAFVAGHDNFSVVLTTNAEASDLLISGLTLTVLDFAQLDTDNATVTVTINGVATVLTEEVEWDAATSDEATATSLASAINALIGVSASAVGDLVTVVIDSNALQLTPNTTTSRASASKKFTSDQDYLNISGSIGGNTDLFDIYVWFEEPRQVDKLTIMFGLGTGTDPYQDDYYYFDFPINKAGTVDTKDAGSNAAAAYAIYADRVRSVLTPEEITEVKNLEQVTNVLKRLGRFAGPRSRERTDTSEASPAWTHLAVTRGQFNRVGSTSGRDWQTVRGFKIVYTAMPGSVKTAQFDDAVWTGGGNRSLTGRFRIGYRYVRDFGRYVEMSPMSPVTEPIDLTQQALQVTIPAAALANKDPQVNQIWVYIIGGFLDTYYRCAVVSAVIRQGMTIDELTNPAGSNFQQANERTRLTSWGFTGPPGSVQADLIFALNKSELEVLIENETMEPGSVGVPNNVIAVAGTFNTRMFVLTDDGRLYPSLQFTPSSFSLYHHLDLRRYGDPLWMLLTSGGIYVGLTKDIIRVAGSGDESDDKVSADLFAEPLHLGNPPVDSSAVTDGNAIVFRSADGLMMLTGVSVNSVPDTNTSLLWRGQDRHGVQALNTAHGRYRYGVDNHILFMIAPEGPTYSPPLTEPGIAGWQDLAGYSVSDEGVLTLDTFDLVNPRLDRELRISEGYVQATIVQLAAQHLGLSRIYSDGDLTKIDYMIHVNAVGIVTVLERGVTIPNVTAQCYPGDVIRVEVVGKFVRYQLNDVVLYTSEVRVLYPLIVDVALGTVGHQIGPVLLFGNWRLIHDGSSAVWQYNLTKQQWSRVVYPVRFCSMFRDPDGALLVGTDEDGQVWELNKGTQDDGANIEVNILTPIDDGGEPLARKDALDFQIHVDTGGGTGTVRFLKDGQSTPTTSVTFSTSRPSVFRANLLALGVLLKVQLGITGSFNRFLLHAFNIMYRNRVPQVMVLDTGTIRPTGTNQMVWLSEIEIDCISPANLVVDLYLDDVLKTTQPVVVKPGKRSGYRVVMPRGSKAKCPRLVFRTTNANGADDPGFEPYQVRIKDRMSGNNSDQEYRPVWPVGEAP